MKCVQQLHQLLLSHHTRPYNNKIRYSRYLLENKADGQWQVVNVLLTMKEMHFGYNERPTAVLQTEVYSQPETEFITANIIINTWFLRQKMLSESEIENSTVSFWWDILTTRGAAGQAIDKLSVAAPCKVNKAPIHWSWPMSWGEPCEDHTLRCSPTVCNHKTPHFTYTQHTSFAPPACLIDS